ncbi:MAG TPA: hypothetical protein VMM58_06800 [Bacteroidota bacterium]|nr:hypothetical protein [Bacteroidota bacterium]
MDQYKRPIVYAGMCVLLAIVATGCSPTNQPTQPDQGLAVSIGAQSSVAASIASDEVEMSKLGGVPIDSSDGEFCIGWDEFVGPLSENGERAGDASAIVFDSLAIGSEGRTPHAGEDIGSVFLNYSGNHQEFKKITPLFGGTFYMIFPHLFDQTGIGVSFSGNTDYEFEATGSSVFSPLTATIVSPPSLITITSHANGQRIHADSDFVVTWTGGVVGGNILIRVTPMIVFGPDGFAPCDSSSEMDEYGRRRPGLLDRFGGFPPGIRRDLRMDFRIDTGYVVLIANNPGQATIPALTLQQTLEGASRVSITVSELSSTGISHDGKSYRLIMRDGDRRMLIVE